MISCSTVVYKDRRSGCWPTRKRRTIMLKKSEIAWFITNMFLWDFNIKVHLILFFTILLKLMLFLQLDFYFKITITHCFKFSFEVCRRVAKNLYKSSYCISNISWFDNENKGFKYTIGEWFTVMKEWTLTMVN